MVTAKKTPARKRPAKTRSRAQAPKRPIGPATKAATKAPITPPELFTPASSKPIAATQLPVKAPSGLAIKKAAKVKKPKLVRDSFTIPKAEYLVLEDLKQRAGKMSSPAKKSELLRAGIKALAAMADSALLAALQAVPTIKTGRPSKV